MPVKRGDKIKVDYTGTLNDGTIFDSTKRTGQPLKFVVGEGLFLDAFENAVIGMEIGEEKHVEIEPINAYGEYNPNLVDEMSLESIPTDKEIFPGMLLIFSGERGEEVPARIIKKTDSEVTLDLNHPLSGIALNFKIKVLEIISKLNHK
jgi:FKBP-type peptidyl-prolyl cis-trans isomerase 2